MHVYIYGSCLSQKKYASALAKIETRITDLGLNGRIIRLSLLQSLDESIQNEIKKGAKTIVVVGTHSLFHYAVNIIANFFQEQNIASSVPLAYIPLNTKGNLLHERLGISPGADACDALSARKIEILDLGQINNKHFLCEAIITARGSNITIDNSYSIKINEVGDIAIINLSNEFSLPKKHGSNAQDGSLELYIQLNKQNKLLSIGKDKKKPSVFNFKSLLIENSQNKKIIIDSCEKISCPAKIKISSQKIKLIVGKGRGF